ncbi:MAG: AAA family ATPase [Planctomyces sp.]
MKILRIALSNLASLSGLHLVDFTSEPLRSAGLFSISGPTGAGKSTLLDAICLALYDQTPRLKQVKRHRHETIQEGEQQHDSRTLLRRGCAEGFAEVVFQGVDSRTWTSRWSVRRSRRNAEGALQAVSMVLYRGSVPVGGDGEIAEGGKRTLVLDEIRKQVGLSFEQFTRAVLLAQNDFATFLRADDGERAEILQALTGTEIFERVSRTVFERSRADQDEIRRIEARLQGNDPLPTDERQALDADLEQLRAALQNNLQLHTTRREQLRWFEQLTEKTAKLHAAEAQLAASIRRRDESGGRWKDLQLTIEVHRTGRPLNDAVTESGRSVETIHAELKVAESSLESGTAVLHQLENQWQVAHAAQQKAEDEQKQLSPVIQQARQLDARLEPVQQRFQASAKSLQGAEQSCAEILQRQAASDQHSKTLIAERHTLEQRENQLTHYRDFVADSGTWIDRMEGVTRRAGQVAKTTEDLKHSREAVASAEIVLKERLHQVIETEAICLQADQAFRAAEAAESQYSIDELIRERSELDAILGVLNAFNQIRKDRDRIDRQLQTRESDSAQLVVSITADQDSLLQIEQEKLPCALTAMQTAERQLKHIQAAVDDHAKRLRSSLQAGMECPVCGSTDHPYAEHEPDAELTAVRASEEFLRECERELVQIRDTLQGLKSRIQSDRHQLERMNEEITGLRAERTGLFSDAEFHPEVTRILAFPEADQPNVLMSRQTELVSRLKAIEVCESEYRQAVAETRIRQEQRDAAERNRQSVTEESQKRQHELEICQRKVLEEEKSLGEYQSEYQLQMERLLPVLEAIPQGTEVWSSAPDQFRDQFLKATTECRQVVSRVAEITAEQARLQAKVEEISESLKSAEATLLLKQQEAVEAEREYKELQATRNQLLDGRSADEIEERLKQQSAHCDLQLRELSLLREDQKESSRRLESDVIRQKDRLQDAERQRESAVSQLNKWLVGISDQYSVTLNESQLGIFLQRDDAWISEERQTLEQIRSEVDRAAGERQAHHQQLEEHLTQRPTPVDEAIVRQHVEELQNEEGTLRQDADRLTLDLRADDERLRENQEIRQRVSEMKVQAEPCSRLNELIGSADGAKFRKVAQRHTLDLLLRYANHHLGCLAARYRMERIPESLNLLVVDQDMGDEKRSVYSLSGGESFLTSLALALGLASLTSNRLKIETLFIDEGFGSLDEETLKVAMNALMQLEAQGRKVGVISHVRELTEAIPVGIQVRRGRGGASSVSVPGVPQTSEAGAAAPVTRQSSGTEQTREPEQSPSAELTAEQLLMILRREKARGKLKVSVKSIRDEIGCDRTALDSARRLLGEAIQAEGRSLSLTAES